MSRVRCAMSISVDGYVAGPHDSPELPLGVNGDRLFRWLSDGEVPSRVFPDFRMSPPSRQFFDAFAAANGAIITGRRTHDLVEGWRGNGPQPGVPLFVLTHRGPVPGLPYTYVGDIHAALDLARTTADGKDIALMGSAPIREALRAGLLDELHLHVVPVLLGGGVRLLDDAGMHRLEQVGVLGAPGVTHLSYRVRR